MSAVRTLAACALCAIGLGVGFVGLLALALSLSSDERIAAHLLEAADRGVLSRSSYPVSSFGGVTEHQYDMYTDCVAFGVNLGNARDGVLRRIAASPTAAHEGNDIGPCGNLVDALRADSVDADLGYLRFWHGYQIYTRPLLSIMPLDAFRRLTAALFFSALLFFAWRLSRVFGPWAWPITLAPFFAVSDFLTVPMVATHALSLTIAFLSAAIVSVILERAPNPRALVLPAFVFCAGAVSNFMNFLVNPPLAPALIAFAYIAITLDGTDRQARRSALYAAALAALWFAGFAAAWIEKWMFAALVLGPDAVLGELQGTVAKYDATRARMDVNFLGASRRNVMNSLAFLGCIVASVAASGAIVFAAVRKHGAWRRCIVEFVAMLTPLAIVVIWVEANRAHSAEHVGFVSRSFLLFAIFPLLAAVKVWRDARSRPV